jgi:hypothetical protein
MCLARTGLSIRKDGRVVSFARRYQQRDHTGVKHIHLAGLRSEDAIEGERLGCGGGGNGRGKSQMLAVGADIGHVFIVVLTFAADKGTDTRRYEDSIDLTIIAHFIDLLFTACCILNWTATILNQLICEFEK